MAKNFLHLNESKTDVIVFGPLGSSLLISSYLRPLSSNVHPCAKNLGVFFDSELKFTKQVSAVVKSSLD